MVIELTDIQWRALETIADAKLRDDERRAIELQANLAVAEIKRAADEQKASIIATMHADILRVGE